MTITDTAHASAHAPASRTRRLAPAGGDRLVLTVTEAGRLLGISRTFAYELAARGDLPVIRFGRRVLVPKRPLLELVGAAADAGWSAPITARRHATGVPGSTLPDRAGDAPPVAS